MPTRLTPVWSGDFSNDALSACAEGYVLNVPDVDFYDLQLWDLRGRQPRLAQQVTLDDSYSLIAWPSGFLDLSNCTGNWIGVLENVGAYRVLWSGVFDDQIDSGSSDISGPTGVGNPTWPAADGSRSVIIGGSGAVYTCWNFDWGITGTWTAGTGQLVRFHPRVDRLVVADTVADEITLREPDGTVIDTLAWGYDGTGSAVYRFIAVSDSQACVIRSEFAGTVLSYRVLETAGDALSWVDTAVTIPHAGYVQASGWNGIVTIVGQSGSSNPVIWLDPLAQEYVTSAAVYGRTLFPVACSPTRVMLRSTDADSVLYGLTPMLRQRQSPRRSPSRVGWY